MCYTIPAAGAIVTTIMWNQSKDIKIWWLNLMFWGGALFGVIDHLWNGELFLISKHIVSDLALGLVITAVIYGTWKIILVSSRTNPVLVQSLHPKI
jgi:hypothetical protein